MTETESQKISSKLLIQIPYLSRRDGPDCLPLEQDTIISLNQSLENCLLTHIPLLVIHILYVVFPAGKKMTFGPDVK